MSDSILQPQYPYKGKIPQDADCYLCHMTAECRHHIYPNGLRKVSEAHGFWVYLCHECHNLHRHSVHLNPELMRRLKAECQAKYEETHTRDEFMKLIGTNYL